MSQEAGTSRSIVSHGEEKGAVPSDLVRPGLSALGFARSGGDFPHTLKFIEGPFRSLTPTLVADLRQQSRHRDCVPHTVPSS